MTIKLRILKLGYFKSRWNWIDFVLVWVRLLEIAMDNVGVQFLKNTSPIRTLRLLRLARVLKIKSSGF